MWTWFSLFLVLLFVACRCFFSSLLLLLLSPFPLFFGPFVFVCNMKLSLFSCPLLGAWVGACSLALRSSIAYCRATGFPFFFSCFAYSSWFIYSHTLTHALSLHALLTKHIRTHTHRKTHTKNLGTLCTRKRKKKGGKRQKDIDSILLYGTK